MKFRATDSHRAYTHIITSLTARSSATLMGRLARHLGPIYIYIYSFTAWEFQTLKIKKAWETMVIREKNLTTKQGPCQTGQAWARVPAAWQSWCACGSRKMLVPPILGHNIFGSPSRIRIYCSSEVGSGPQLHIQIMCIVENAWKNQQPCLPCASDSTSLMTLTALDSERRTKHH